MDVRVGDIVHLSGLNLPYRDKKFAVCVRVSPNRFLLVNSEKRELYDCIPLDKRGREFPRHDSFIGCKNIFTAEDSQIDSHHGRLEEDELRVLMEKIQSSPYIPKVEKSPIVSAIAEELLTSYPDS